MDVALVNHIRGKESSTPGYLTYLDTESWIWQRHWKKTEVFMALSRTQHYTFALYNLWL